MSLTVPSYPSYRQKASAAPGLMMMPDGDGALVSSHSNTANLYGSWSQLTASAPAAIYIVGLMLDVPTFMGDYLFWTQLGKGASGSEVVIAEFGHRLRYSGSETQEVAGVIPLQFPIPVAAGTRLAARGKMVNTSNLRTWTVWLQYIAQSNVEAF